MAKWEEKLPPLAREKLAKIGEPTPEEKEKMKNQEKVKSIMARYYKGELDSNGLWQEFKGAKPSMLKEAQLNLINSLSFGSSPAEFQKRRDGILAIETLKEEQNTSVLELNLNSIEDLQKRAKEEFEQTYNNFKVWVERNPQARMKAIKQGQTTIVIQLSVDEAIKENPQWQQFQTEYNKRYCQEFNKTKERLKKEVK